MSPIITLLVGFPLVFATKTQEACALKPKFVSVSVPKPTTGDKVEVGTDGEITGCFQDACLFSVAETDKCDKNLLAKFPFASEATADKIKDAYWHDNVTQRKFDGVNVVFSKAPVVADVTELGNVKNSGYKVAITINYAQYNADVKGIINGKINHLFLKVANGQLDSKLELHGYEGTYSVIQEDADTTGAIKTKDIYMKTLNDKKSGYACQFATYTPEM